MEGPYELLEGDQPLLISVPHDGTEIPSAIAQRMHRRARSVPDTDWHTGEFYSPLASALGASLIRPRWSRYVVDLNRPADGKPLYPGRAETGLLPLVGFDGEPLYLPGEEPGNAEQAERVDVYWRPYHQALADELARLAIKHPRVLLWEGHSIRSVCPMFFEGQLTDLNLGTADGNSADDELLAQLMQQLGLQQRFRAVANGRFKGGFITRHFGRPANGVHAVQLEMTQVSYMNESPPFAWEPERAAAAQATVGRMLETALGWIRGG